MADFDLTPLSDSSAPAPEEAVDYSFKGPAGVVTGTAPTSADALAIGKATIKGSKKPAFGTRLDGTPKGLGYFGELRRPDGQISTELSIGINLGGTDREVPALVPTLTKTEIDHLLSGGKPTAAIVEKAAKHAQSRIAAGKDPFAGPGEQISLRSNKSRNSGFDFDLTPLAVDASTNVPNWNISETIVKAGEAVKEGSKVGLANTAAAADFLYGLFTMPIAYTATQAETVAGLLRGEDRKQAEVGGRKLGEKVGELVHNPLQGLLRMAGLGEYYNKALPTQAMEQLTSFLESAGSKVEESTGGKITKEEVLNAADTLMIGLVGRGATATRAAKQRAIATGESVRQPTELGARESYGARPVEQPRYPEEQPGVAPVSGEPPAGEPARDPNAYEVGGKPPAPDERISIREGLALLHTPAFARTAVDNLRLQRFKEGGFADPDFAKALAIGGAGALTAGYLWNQRDKLSPAVQVALDSIAGYVGTDREGFQTWVGPAIGAMFLPALPGHPKTIRAQEMLRRGVSREEVWRETGIFKGRDNKLRFELSDEGAQLNPNVRKNSFDESLVIPAPVFGEQTLGDILQHDRLFELHPEWKDIPVKSTGLGNFFMKGAYDPKTKTMYLAGGKPVEVKSTVLHELQHIEQTEAEFARGGNPPEFLPADFEVLRKKTDDIFDILRKDLNKFADKAINEFTIQGAIKRLEEGKPLYEYQKRELAVVKDHPQFNDFVEVTKAREELRQINSAAHEQYKKLAGEAEARLVQKRMNMTAAERRAKPPWEDFDVPELEQIVRWGDQALSMAVKEKGGMWHPEAVQRLSEPLRQKLASREVLQVGVARAATDVELAMMESDPGTQWATKAIRNYLNKHAGTATDPLKDVKIPMLGEDVRWEDVMDQVIQGHKADKSGMLDYQVGSNVKARPGEVVWKLQDRADGLPRLEALHSVLSHVGDYLREFVPAEKLQQYDLVRAVRETAAQDAKQAKAMEKARVLGTGTVPYKEYPDGMKWVEVGVPGKEMPAGYSVSQAKTTTGKPYWKVDVPKDGTTYIGDGDAIDVKVNKFPSKEAAETAAKQHAADTALKNEGNVMGHCVGGYCEMVHEGSSKIYSLRDAKGMSHVTVEVQPERWSLNDLGPELEAQFMKEVPQGSTKADVKAWMDSKGFIAKSNILQIKGKQNRAPVEQYLPYVQDFVKSGKWGDVGDLENAGLVRRGDRYLTKEEYLIEDNKVPPGFPAQQGFTNLELALGITATSIGALIGGQIFGQDNIRGYVYGALAGAILGTGAGRQLLKEPAKGLDYLAGATATRLEELAGPRVRQRFRDLHRHIFNRTARAQDQVLPFMQAMKELPAQTRLAVARYLWNEDFDAVQTVREVANVFQPVRNLLQGLEVQHKELGRFKEGVANFFPRLVKDLPGLKKYLGQELNTGLEHVLIQAEAAMIKSKNRPLSDVEMSLVINRWLHAPEQISRLPGYARGRRVREITEGLQPFYHDPVESLLRYISGSITDLETARFFGRDLASKTRGSRQYTDIDESIGNFTERALRAGELKPENAEEFRKLLRDRFGPGERSMAGPLQDLRNLSNLTLLAQLGSAATQIGDAVMTVYHHGLVPTLLGAAQMVRGASPLTPRQLGLVNHIAEEMTGGRASGTALRVGLKAATFQYIDQFGKQLNISAGIVRNQWRANGRNQLGLPDQSALAQLERKWGPAFGEDFPQLLEDLRNRRSTDLTESLAFSELSDAQPISKAELPQAYQAHPNGRLLYQLKTWMLKQADIVRRDAYDKMRSGNLKEFGEGVKNLTALATVYALAQVPGDVISNWINGREEDIFTTPNMVENILKNFGLNRYQTDRLAAGRHIEVIKDFVFPPLQVFVDVARGTDKAWAAIPIAGRAIYNRYFGGNERSEIAQRRGLGTSERKPLSLEARKHLRKQYQQRLEEQRAR